MFFKINLYQYLISFLLLIISTHQNQNDIWSIIFYTGSRYLSGSSTDIYIQIHGSLGNSETIYLKKNEPMKSGSAKKFDFNINNNNYNTIGKIERLTIRIQPLLPMFYDWNLYKAELIDPQNKTYTFNCDCWFKYSTPKRTLFIAKSNESDTDQIIETSQFSLAVGLLTILTILIVFVYISNILRKRWRNRLSILNFNNHNFQFEPRTNNNDTTSNTTYNNRNQQIVLNPQDNTQNLNTVTTSLLTDKSDLPPLYKDLFPDNNNNNSNAQNNQENKYNNK